MWLLPVFSSVSRLSTQIFYRVTISGADRLPMTGPVIVVANHPNSLIDPMLVVAAAGRPIRFLAKAPLFSDKMIGWAVRASGSIPVHRQVDDPGRIGENVNMFRAVHTALKDGAAVGLFPEGISHSEPSLTPLKTGAARMALGTVTAYNIRFPIIPVGMVLPDKSIFRSEVHVVVGNAIPWDDLAEHGEEDRDAVRALTERIDKGLRAVTINLASWSDRPLVECADEIWAAEHGASRKPAPRLNRIATITAVLAAHRNTPHPEGDDLIAALTRHRRRLARVHLSPSDLYTNVSWMASIPWTLWRLLIVVPATIVGLFGKALFLVPYHLTGRLARTSNPDIDQVSTRKLLYGMGANLAWLVIMGVVAMFAGGWLLAFVVWTGAPLAALAAIWTTEQWERAGHDARRFFLAHRKRALIEHLRAEQGRIADRLHQMLTDWNNQDRERI